MMHLETYGDEYPGSRATFARADRAVAAMHRHKLREQARKARDGDAYRGPRPRPNSDPLPTECNAWYGGNILGCYYVAPVSWPEIIRSRRIILEMLSEWRRFTRRANPIYVWKGGAYRGVRGKIAQLDRRYIAKARAVERFARVAHWQERDY